MNKNISKVVLVQPPVEDFYLTRKRTLPYGLAVLAACIRKHGFDVSIIDGLATAKSRPVEWPDSFDYLRPYYPGKDISLFSLFSGYTHFGYSYEHIGKLVRDQQPFLVGISSLFTAYADQALKTAETIKKFYPECLIVMGGHHPTRFPEQTLAHPAIDLVLRGETETSMPALCRAVQQKAPINQIPGIAFQKKNQSHISAPCCMDTLSNTPMPAFELINHKYYSRKKRGTIMVVSSRGCPMHCSYCSVSASSSHMRYRVRNPESVVREVEAQLADREIGFIDFEDENLCLNKKWFMSLFSLLEPVLKGKDIELRAMNGLYPAALDEQIIATLKNAGFKTLNLSLGSTCKHQLKRFQRPDVRASFESALDLARQYDLESVSYLIAAAPGQTAQSSLDDLVYLAAKRTLAGLSIFYPAPGSLDYQACIDKNILPDTYSLMRSTALPISDTTTRPQAATLLRLSRIINFMKYLLDNGHTLPDPEPFSDTFCASGPPERLETSIQLLQWFLHDGLIRGVSPLGGIFTHICDTDLTRQFLEKIKSITVRGTKS